MLFETTSLHQFIRITLAIVIALIGFYTFGDAVVFDRLFVVTLLILLILFKSAIDIIGVIIILLAQRAIEEFAYPLVYVDLAPIKLLVYLLCVVGVVKIRHDKSAWFLGPALFTVIMAECYWWYSDYEEPAVWWFALLAGVSMAVRKSIWKRSYYTRMYFPNRESKNIDVDYYIYELNLAYTLVNVAMVLEYLVRHILKIQSLYIYHSFEYISHGIAVITLFLILDQALKHLNRNLIKA